MKTAPLLSIGMIFKNEVRCLERCMRSLQPLREAIPCELIMADTGSDDGSRVIAEHYADEVFDFAWCNDFAAARNAVMDRCTGKWYFSVDCDEWLDADISELLEFLQGSQNANCGFVIVRNYHSADLELSENYSDFFAFRLMRMATGLRYSGVVHESWPYVDPANQRLHTILHHDGYFYADPELGKKKQQRNMELLLQDLEKEPENLLRLMQCMEGGKGHPDFTQYVRRAVHIVQAHPEQTQILAGSIMRHAVDAARKLEMPELDAWIKFAEEQFPDSIYVQIDLQYNAFHAAYDAGKWGEAIRHGEAYRAALRSHLTGRPSKATEDELSIGVLLFATPFYERTVLAGLADAYCQSKQSEAAMQILAELDGSKLDDKQVRNFVVALCHLHAQSFENVAPLVTAFYEQINQETPSRQKKQARLAAFNDIASACFTAKYQKQEKGHEGYWRPAYTAFAILADRCEAGRGAAILLADSSDRIRTLLARVEDWQALPIEALKHALQIGVSFLSEEKPLPMEVLEGLAARLAGGENVAKKLALALPEHEEYPDRQSLFWAQSLVIAALYTFDWSLGKKNASESKFACPEKTPNEDGASLCTAEEGVTLIRRFAQIESAVLPLLYTPQAMADENAALLPSAHRWGLYCSRAMEALDNGNPQEYLAILRKGLAACPGQKVIVQFLLDRFREDARPKTSPELLALAERVRTILAAYRPDDPAVAALKATPAYQQVAWIIESEPMDRLPQ